MAAPAPSLPADAPWPKGKRWWARAGALAAGVLSVGAATLGWRASIAPIARPDTSIYTAATIDRGRQLAALGDCAVCHTAPGGIANVGGRAMDTPFGTIVTTNLTPDVETGIGGWSFAAFQRAMREGISRDGRHLYPAFPYTAFAKMADDDLMALYAYLMAQPAVRHEVTPSRLRFPFGVRPLMALWNALYLDPAPAAQDATRSPLWNRGAYLVEGPGHCGGCHTPRNALGAEQSGRAHLAGAMVEDWEAPPLTALSHAPVPWNEDELFRYLRFGITRQHGVAAGPMAPVVRELATVPEDDVRAMAHYLASFNAPPASDAAATAQASMARSRAQDVAPGAAQRLFATACGACHHDGDGPSTLGPNLPLALNSNLHSARPDNLLRVVLEGIRDPATPEIGFMPAFRDALDDRQVAGLAAYMRARFAPGKPAWQALEEATLRMRRRGDP